MIISRTPFRISLFGGGTDYPQWFREHGGAVLGTTIDKYCYISVRYLPPYFTHKSRVVYSKEEWVNDNNEIEHPAIRECLNFERVSRGVEISHQSDLFARKGLGTSSAFVVGLLNALKTLKGKRTIPSQLSRHAIDVEQNWIKESVGCQDQYHCAYGGFNKITFSNNFVDVIPIDGSQLQPYLMMFDTGTSRIASHLAQSQIAQIPYKEFILRQMGDLVNVAVDYIRKGDIEVIGKLLHETWQLKKSISNAITTPPINDIYDTAIKAGVTGGKLLGAGGGGYILFFVPPDKQSSVLKALRDLIYVPFKFENKGSQVIFNDEPAKERSGWGEEVAKE